MEDQKTPQEELAEALARVQRLGPTTLESLADSIHRVSHNTSRIKADRRAVGTVCGLLRALAKQPPQV